MAREIADGLSIFTGFREAGGLDKIGPNELLTRRFL
jgi:hypothetical protein